MSKIIVIRQPRTFRAKLFDVPWESEVLKLAATLDGFIDLSIPQGKTYPLSMEEARKLSVALNGAIADVESNCLHECDELLTGAETN